MWYNFCIAVAAQNWRVTSGTKYACELKICRDFDSNYACPVPRTGPLRTGLDAIPQQMLLILLESSILVESQDKHAEVLELI